MEILSWKACLGTHSGYINVPNSGLLKYEGCRGEIALGLSPKGNRGFK